MIRFRALSGLLLATWLLCGSASGAEYDPKLTWRTIVTEHFRIHFHQGEEQLADEFSRMVEDVYATMSEELRWRMRMRTDVVLIDRTDQANGFASAVPYNNITIFVTAPTEDATLSSYEDWSEAIFTHELAHILHLETHGGVVAAARALVGRIASTNSVSPPWTVEGLATFQETRHTAAGRGRSPYVHMIKRTAVVEDAFPPLGNLDGFQAALPAGNLRYLFGQDFMAWVAEQQGADVWTRWTHAYGRSLPYLLFLLPPKRVFGDRIQRLYRGWREHTFQVYGEQVARIEAEGIREGELLSDPRSSCTSPSFAPTGDRLIWSCYDLRTGNALWIADGDGRDARKLKQDVGAKTFTWRRDGKAFVYATTHVVNRFNHWSDIYLYDVEKQRSRALTAGARARDPDFSPDGTELLMVTNRSQDTQLEVLTVDQRRTRLTDHRDHTQYATPRYAPAGDAIAVSVWQQGRRDLWIAGRDGRLLRRLTADAANDRDPAWSPDGRWLFFTSDRSGVPNIYAVDVATERLWQVTNVRTGASKPSVHPDGRRLVYQQYSADGWEVRLLALDPTTWLDRGHLPAPLAGGPALRDLVTPVEAPIAVVPDAAARWDALADEVGGRRRSGDAALDGGEIALHPRLGADAPPPSAGPAPRQDGEILGTYEQARVDDAFGEERDYPFAIPPRRYNPLPSLIPRYWYPTIGTTPRLPGEPQNAVSRAFDKLPEAFNLGGLAFQASTAATDPLRHYAYRAWVSYRTDANRVGGGAAFTINRWLPVVSFGASTAARPFTYQVTHPWQPVDERGDPEFTRDDLDTVFMREVDAFLSLTYPFTHRSTFFASYDLRWRRLAGELDPAAWEPSVALRGTIGSLTVGYGYSWGQPTALAVSPEDARTVLVSGTVSAPWLGTFAVDDDGERTGVTQVLLSADWREFLVNPLAPNHVFALRAGAGVAFGGADRFLGNFQLGGNGVGGARTLRGYPFGAARGDSYWLAGAEYRMPLWRIDRGFGTVPLFFRYLALSVFAEAGNAFTSPDGVRDAFDDTLVGVGAELRLATLVGWAGGVEVRLGYAVGLTQGGYWFDDPRTLYVLLSTSF